MTRMSALQTESILLFPSSLLAHDRLVMRCTFACSAAHPSAPTRIPDSEFDQILPALRCLISSILRSSDSRSSSSCVFSVCNLEAYQLCTDASASPTTMCRTPSSRKRLALAPLMTFTPYSLRDSGHPRPLSWSRRSIGLLKFAGEVSFLQLDPGPEGHCEKVSRALPDLAKLKTGSAYRG